MSSSPISFSPFPCEQQQPSSSSSSSSAWTGVSNFVNGPRPHFLSYFTSCFFFSMSSICFCSFFFSTLFDSLLFAPFSYFSCPWLRCALSPSFLMSQRLCTSSSSLCLSYFRYFIISLDIFRNILSFSASVFIFILHFSWQFYLFSSQILLSLRFRLPPFLFSKNIRLA